MNSITLAPQSGKLLNLASVHPDRLLENDCCLLEDLGRAIVLNSTQNTEQWFRNISRTFLDTTVKVFTTHWAPPATGAVLRDVLQEASFAAVTSVVKTLYGNGYSEEKIASLLQLASIIDSSFCWAQEILAKAPSDASEQVIAFFMANHNNPELPSQIQEVTRKYGQILSGDYEYKVLDCDRSKILRIAITIVQLYQTDQIPLYIKKDHRCPNSLLYGSATRTFYILCKYKSGRWIKISPQHKISTALCVAFNTSIAAYPLCQTVPRGRTTDSLSEKDILLELNGKPGIWPIEHMCTYLSEKQGSPCERFSTLSVWAATDLAKLDLKVLSDRDQIAIARCLILGLHSMHSNNIVHGDIKYGNVLVSRSKDTMVAGFIDFGFAFYYPIRSVKALHWIFCKGHYGSIKCTPPEQWGNIQERSGPIDSINAIDYFAMDVWALGYLLWGIQFGALPPWSQMLYDHYENALETGTWEVSPEEKKALRESIYDVVESPLQFLSNPSTMKEKYHRLLYQMMRLNPRDRLTAVQLVEMMEQFSSEK